MSAPLRFQPWSEFRDTFVITVPASRVDVEPEFAGPGSKIEMLIRPAYRREAIDALRSLADELEGMEPRP